MNKQKLIEIQYEIDQQPEIVSQVLNRLKQPVMELADSLVKRGIMQIYIVGSGDSWFLGNSVRLAFENFAGINIEAIQAFEFATYGKPNLNERCAIIVISSSGRPSTTVDALERALNSPAFVIGISDKIFSGNPFIEKVHFSLVPEASKIGAPTQSTTVTFAVLILLAIKFGQSLNFLNDQKANELLIGLQQVPVLMQKVLEENKFPLKTLSNKLNGQRQIIIVGGGPSSGVAQIGCALLFAIPKIFGLPLMLEEFHHAWLPEALTKNIPVIFIAPTGNSSARNFETAEVANEYGANTIAIVDTEDNKLSSIASSSITLPVTREVFSPLLTTLPLQQLSVNLAMEDG